MALWCPENEQAKQSSVRMKQPRTYTNKLNMLDQSGINKTNHQNASEGLYSTQVMWTTFVILDPDPVTFTETGSF